MRLFSLAKAAYDAAVNGKPSVGPKQLGLHVLNCSSFTIWSIPVSRLTGMVAYCSADGTVYRFQLKTKVVEKDLSKHKAPHFACGSLSEDESVIVVSTPLPNALLPLKRPVNDSRNNPKSKQLLSVSIKPAKIPASDDQPLDETTPASKSKKKPKSKSGNKQQEGEDHASMTSKMKEERRELGIKFKVYHLKLLQCRVRWNMNKGGERWPCSGGAAGIVRCQEIKMSGVYICLARKR